MIKDKLIFNGNEKQVFSTDDPSMVIFRYKDVATAFHGVKRARFAGKGILDNEISGLLLGYLNDNGVETHFIRTLGDEREQLCRMIEIIPLEVVFHNRISGSLASKLGVEDGFKPSNTILDLCYNNDELGDPLINRDQAVALRLATYQELDGMYDIVRRSGQLLTDLLDRAGIELVDAKFEFGRAADTGAIIISDEISPDTCRMWDKETGERLDKDRFRLDLGDLVPSYGIVLEKLKTALDLE
jgi:phosphoribosylaminoimidazole-succinocarboxamide synthase